MTNNNTITFANNTITVRAYKTMINTLNLIKTRKEYDFLCNPYFFVIGLKYAQFKGDKLLENKIKEVCNNTDFFFEVWEDGSVNSLSHGIGNGEVQVTFLNNDGSRNRTNLYYGPQAFEVLRDLTLPVVMNWK